MDCVRLLPLNQFFGRAILKSAEVIASSDKAWRGPVAWYRPGGQDAQALQGEFTEKSGVFRIITVYLYPLFGAIAIDSECTCKFRSCAHAAALLIRLRRLVDWPRAMTPAQRWLHTLNMPLDPVASKEAHDIRPLRTIVLLSSIENQQLSVLAAQLVLTDPTARIEQRQCWRRLEHDREERAVAPQTLVWQALLARGRDRSGPGGPWHELRGSEGAALLDEWLKAGICHHAETLQRIWAGAMRSPRWEWLRDSQANAHLQLKLSEDASVRAIDLGSLHYLDETSGEFGPLNLPKRTWSMIERMPAVSPEDATLTERWPPHALLSAIPSPPAPRKLPQVRGTPAPILVIGASQHAGHEDYVFHVSAWADYAGCRVPLGKEPWKATTVVRASGGPTTLHRDIDVELKACGKLVASQLVGLKRLVPDAWRALTPAPAVFALAHPEHHRGDAQTFIALDSKLQSLGGSGFRIEYDPTLPFSVLPEKTPLRGKLRDGDRVGWTQFDLAAMCDGEEINVLPIILKGLRHREFSLSPTRDEPANAHWFAPLGSDRYLPLALSQLREWLTPLLVYVRGVAADHADPVQLPRTHAISLTDRLQQQGIRVDGPAARSIADTIAALRAAQETACAIPSTYRGELRHYQVQGLHWLQALRSAQLGGVLADDMGLGKTVQIIAHLLLELEGGRFKHPALIVAPTTLVFNWLDELARFAPDLKCINFTGSGRTRLRESLAKAHVIVTSYALLIAELPTLQMFDYDLLVLDEAQWVKNPLAQTARAARTLRAPHKLAVTGTPLENHLGELWAHMDLVMPGYLGDYRSFNRAIRVPVEQHQDDRRLKGLRQLTAPFVLRRTKAAVAPELPEKSETVLRVAMAAEQRSLYESLRLSLSCEVREALAHYSQEQSHIVVLAALMRLRQVCCDPRLIERSDCAPGSAKLDTLLQLLQSLREEGRSVLVFSQFTSMLELMSEALRAARLNHTVLTGNTDDRRIPVRSFQSGEVGILLASLKAGGLGLNLTAADVVIHYDPWWNPAVERQAEDRAHRIGRELPVFVYKLICEDTIEEKIAAMKARKSDLARAVLAEDSFAPATLSEPDVRMLFNLPPSA